MRRTGVQIEGLELLYQERFRAFLLSTTAMVGDGEAALDIVQESFARALRRRREFRGEGSLEAWLWKITLNVARDHVRAQGRRPGLLTQEPRSESQSEAESELRVSLLSLPERQRAIVFLRYFGDMSYEQIADALDISAGTVAAALHAAHASLRLRLEGVAQ